MTTRSTRPFLLALVLAGAGCAATPPPVAHPTARVDASGGQSKQGVGGAPNRYAGFSMRQRQFIENEDASFQSSVTYYQEHCRAPIDAHIEWSTFLGEVDRNLDGQANYSFRLFCAYPLDHLAAQCSRSEADRQAVVARVRSYSCVYGGPGRRAISLAGGQATMAVDWEAPNYEAFVSDYFGRAL